MIISRVAENAFWLARYLERVDNLSRLLRVNNNFVLDVDLLSGKRWYPLIVVVGEEQNFLDYTEEENQDDGEIIQNYLTWEVNNPSSIYSSLGNARENARIIRETISLEMWEVINSLWLWINDNKTRKFYQRERYGFYQHLNHQFAQFQGFALDTMLQSEAYNFMRLGASLERTNQIARILDVKYHALGPTEPHFEKPLEVAQWQAILQSCSAIEPFFKDSYKDPGGLGVARFLFFNPDFPRSITRSLDRAWNFHKLIRPGGGNPTGKKTDELLKSLRAEIKSKSMEEIMEHGLHKTLTQIVESVALICHSVKEEYFQARPVVIKHSAKKGKNR